MTNPHPEGTGEWLLHEIFAEQPLSTEDDRCEDCGGRFIRGSHYCFGSTT